MLRTVIVVLGLFGAGLAYREHGYNTEVNHVIPVKIVEDSQEGGQENGIEGNQEDGIAVVLLGGGLEGIGQEGLVGGIEGVGVRSEEAAGEQSQEENQNQRDESEGSGRQQQQQQQDFFAGDYFHYPKYRYEYGVKDYHTGDHKSQWEIRDGDLVKGEYTLIEPDGTHRVVKYKADDKNGFQAEVQRNGLEYGGSSDQQDGLDSEFQEGTQGGQADRGRDSAYSYSKIKLYR